MLFPFGRSRPTAGFTRKGQNQIHLSQPPPAPCRVQAFVGQTASMEGKLKTQDHQVIDRKQFAHGFPCTHYMLPILIF